MKPSHTPTPWNESQGARDSEFNYIYGPQQFFICEIDISHPENKANAAFIVRAVNAHEDYEKAIRTAIKDIENGSLGNALSILRYAITKPHKADVTCLPDCKIAKAEGK